MMKTLFQIALLLAAASLTVADGPVCDGEWFVNHTAADSHAEVRVTLKLQSFGGDAHFQLNYTGYPYSPEGSQVLVDAWCADYDRPIAGGDYIMDIFSAFDPNVHSDAVDKPNRLPALAWMINNYQVGDVYDDGNGCSGTLTWRDLQGATWYIIDDKQGLDNNYYTGSGNYGRTECISTGIADLAIAWLDSTVDGTYEIDCSDPDQLIPLMYIVDEGSGDEGDILNQVLISETNIHSVEGLCVCIEDTPVPTPSPSLPPDDTPSPTTPPGTQGDPHFKTHGGETYDVGINVFWYGCSVAYSLA